MGQKDQSWHAVATVSCRAGVARILYKRVRGKSAIPRAARQTEHAAPMYGFADTADISRQHLSGVSEMSGGLEIGKRPVCQIKMLFHNFTESFFEYLSRLQEPDQIASFFFLIGTV